MYKINPAGAPQQGEGCRGECEVLFWKVRCLGSFMILLRFPRCPCSSWSRSILGPVLLRDGESSKRSNPGIQPISFQLPDSFKCQGESQLKPNDFLICPWLYPDRTRAQSGLAYVRQFDKPIIDLQEQRT